MAKVRRKTPAFSPITPNSRHCSPLILMGTIIGKGLSMSPCVTVYNHAIFWHNTSPVTAHFANACDSFWKKSLRARNINAKTRELQPND
jgi:hypothetical protein